MKKCPYCGRNSEDAAIQCSECLTELRNCPSFDPSKVRIDPRDLPGGHRLLILPLRQCSCGGEMSPTTIERRRWSGGIRSTYQCGSCLKQRGFMDDRVLIGNALTFFGSFIPYTKMEQFSSGSLYCYIAFQIAFFGVLVRIYCNDRNYPPIAGRDFVMEK